MFRNMNAALVLSLALVGVAAAEPQTVSYYSGAGVCSGGTCDLVASLPAQGFVLTDIICSLNNGNNIQVVEVDGLNTLYKVDFLAGQPPGSSGRQLPVSYHLNSGIPFAGGKGLRIQSLDTQNWTLVGYIPGTSASSVPAVGGVGLLVMIVGMLAAGGVLLRKASQRQAPGVVQ